MKKIICLFLTCILYQSGYTQDIGLLKSNLSSVISSINENISSRDQCDAILSDLDDIKLDIENILRAKDKLNSAEVNDLKATLFSCESFCRFIETVGVTSRVGMSITEAQMNHVSITIPFQFSELTNYKFCASIYEVRFNKYKSLIVKKSGDREIFRIKAKLVSINGMSSQEISFGVQANQYKKLTNNAKNLNSNSLKVTSMTCSVGYIPL